MFVLRLHLNEIHTWADRYDYPEEEIFVQEVGPRIRGRRFCTAADLVRLCEWKSPRIRSRCGKNEPAYVEAVTRIALTTPHERLRIEVLTLLSGVGWPMASVILHWGHHDPYPILDSRALWSLGISDPPAYTFEFWEAYTGFCRHLSHHTSISMRRLDRALWQYAKENQL